MSAIGSNPDDLDDLARKLDGAANGLHGSRASVSSSLEDAYWEGNDAQWFRQSWYGPSSAGLRASTDALRSLATLLRGEANEQRLASEVSPAVFDLGISIPPGLFEIGGLKPLPFDLFNPFDPFNPKDGFGHVEVVSGEYLDKDEKPHAYTYTKTRTIDENGNRIETTEGTDENGKPIYKKEDKGLVDTEFKIEHKFSENEWFRGPRKTWEGDFTLNGHPAEYSASGGAVAYATSEGSYGHKDGKAFVGGAVGVGAMAFVKGSVETDIGGVKVGATGGASVGAYAKAEGNAHAGLDGFGASAHLDAFAGGRANAELSGEYAGVKATGGVGVSYGIGGHADVDFDVSLTKVKAKVDIGATLGLGGQLKFDIEIDPVETFNSVMDWIGS
jgi:hypothetical protein